MGQFRRSKIFSCFKHIVYKDVGAMVQFYFGGAKVSRPPATRPRWGNFGGAKFSIALNTSYTKMLAQWLHLAALLLWRSKIFNCFKHILYKEVGAMAASGWLNPKGTAAPATRPRWGNFGGAKFSLASNTSYTKMLAPWCNFILEEQKFLGRLPPDLDGAISEEQNFQLL